MAGIMAAMRTGSGVLGTRSGMQSGLRIGTARRITQQLPQTMSYTSNATSLRFADIAVRNQISRQSASSSKGFILIHPTRSTKSPIFRRLFSSSRARRTADPTPHLGSPPQAESLSLSQRMRKLSREYGWSALGVYLALTALDLPFCYLLVLWLGTDRIGEFEHWIVSNVAQIIPESVKQTWRGWRAAMKQSEVETTGNNDMTESVEMAGWGVEEAQAANKKEASLATRLAFAYAIHKSFIFVRVPLTAALTPKIVKVLRGWGWDIGKKTTKAAKAAKRSAIDVKKT